MVLVALVGKAWSDSFIHSRYEKLFNPSLQYHDEQEFVDYILADQPETPFYFAVMKRVNKVGPD